MESVGRFVIDDGLCRGGTESPQPLLGSRYLARLASGDCIIDMGAGPWKGIATEWSRSRSSAIRWRMQSANTAKGIWTAKPS